MLRCIYLSVQWNAHFMLPFRCEARTLLERVLEEQLSGTGRLAPVECGKCRWTGRRRRCRRFDGGGGGRTFRSYCSLRTSYGVLLVRQPVALVGELHIHPVVDDGTVREGGFVRVERPPSIPVRCRYVLGVITLLELVEGFVEARVECEHL